MQIDKGIFSHLLHKISVLKLVFYVFKPTFTLRMLEKLSLWKKILPEIILKFSKKKLILIRIIWRFSCWSVAKFSWAGRKTLRIDCLKIARHVFKACNMYLSNESFLTIVRGGESALNPPTGSLGHPVTNWRNWRCSSRLYSDITSYNIRMDLPKNHWELIQPLSLEIG